MNFWKRADGLSPALIDVSHVRRQNKWDKIELDGSKHVSVAKDTTKVNMEHVTSLADHDVVVMAITYPQHIGSHTVASTRVSEVLYSLQQ